MFEAVEAVGFAAARQTFVAVTADATPLGPALLWSDRRAGDEALELGGSFGDEGGETVRRRTGVVLDGGSVAAKVAWLERHEPETLKAARWLLAPRDLIAWRLTGVICTDDTLASATGLFAIADDHIGPLLAGLVDDVADLLPSPVAPTTVLGGLLAGPAQELGLRAGMDVVIGAGDRACEVIGAHASETRPMVSWGTTANVSVPVTHLGGGGVPPAMIATRGAFGGWLLEGGLSAAGSLIDWLARLAGSDVHSVMALAGSSPPGARGVIVLPWFGGARAPWWRDTARGAVVGLSLEHGVGDVARAVSSPSRGTCCGASNRPGNHGRARPRQRASSSPVVERTSRCGVTSWPRSPGCRRAGVLQAKRRRPAPRRSWPGRPGPVTESGPIPVMPSFSRTT